MRICEDILADALELHGRLFDVMKRIEKDAENAEDYFGIKACPFCGGTYVYIHAEQVKRDIHFFVYCAECGVRTKGFNSTRTSKAPFYSWFSPTIAIAEALQSWNNRPSND